MWAAWFFIGLETGANSGKTSKALRVNITSVKMHCGTIVVIITGHTLMALVMQGIGSEGNGSV